MSSSARVRKKEIGGKSAVETTHHDSVDASSAAQLIGSIVYRRLPAKVRRRLDEAILLRPPGCATCEAIARKFRLVDRYRVSLFALKSYARRLEALARPVITSRVIAQMLNSLPESDRSEMIAGGEILLLSRLTQSLLAAKDASLSIADLAKLATILASAGGKPQNPRPHAKGESGKKKPKCDQGENADEAAPTDAKGLAEAVHLLYGLTCPTECASKGVDSTE